MRQSAGMRHSTRRAHIHENGLCGLSNVYAPRTCPTSKPTSRESYIPPASWAVGWIGLSYQQTHHLALSKKSLTGKLSTTFSTAIRSHNSNRRPHIMRNLISTVALTVTLWLPMVQEQPVHM